MRALPLLALALLALPLAPAASAQGLHCAAVPQLCQTNLQISIAPPPDLVEPLGPVLAVPMTIDYTYAPTPMTFAPTQVQLTVTQFPPWLTASVAPSTVYMQVTAQPSGLAMQSSPSAQAFLLLSAGMDAPAFTSAVVEVTATAQGNGGLNPSTTSTQLPVQAGYLGLLDVKAATSGLALRPGDGQVVPLRVANLGNAATRVTFAVDEAPAGLEVFPPGDLNLASPLESDDDTEATVLLGLNAPGRYAAGQVVLLATPAYSLDPSWAGEPGRVVVHVAPSGSGEPRVQTLGAGGEVMEPFTWGLLAAGAAGVVLLERRRRRRA